MKKLLRGLLSHQSSQGDLLIEVMLAIAVLAVILTGGYVLSHKGLNSSTNSDLRSQAQSLAQGQIEYMVSTQNAGSSKLSEYVAGNPFCILSDGSVDIADPETNPALVCPDYQNGIGIGITYKPSSKTFAVTAKWNVKKGNTVTDRNNLEYKDQVVLYYKLPINFSSNDIALNVYIRGKGKGKVTSDIGGINCSNKNMSGKNCSVAFGSTQTVTLTESSLGGIFKSWSGDCKGTDTTCTVTVDRIKYVAAEFRAPASNPGGGGCGVPCNCIADGVGNLYCEGGWPPGGGGGGGSDTNPEPEPSSDGGGVTCHMDLGHCLCSDGSEKPLSFLWNLLFPKAHALGGGPSC